MSSIPAALGRGQLETLSERVEARRENFAYYREALKDVPGIGFMPEADYGRSSRWLSCLLIDSARFGASAHEIKSALEAENIESRFLWKPMHTQPVFADCERRGGAVAEGLFATGLCLPSGSDLSVLDKQRIVGIIKRVGVKHG